MTLLKDTSKVLALQLAPCNLPHRDRRCGAKEGTNDTNLLTQDWKGGLVARHICTNTVQKERIFNMHETAHTYQASEDSRMVLSMDMGGSQHRVLHYFG